MTTLLIAEHDHASLKDSTNKALTAASELGAEVHVLVAGGGEGPRLPPKLHQNSRASPRCY